MPVYVWARRWVAEQWPAWQPRTRRGDVYSLARFIPLVTGPGAREPPARLRAYLCRTLPPDVEIDQDDVCERWLSRWVVPLGDLNRDFLADVSRCMGVGDKDQPLANATVRRYRRVAHSCVRRAIELGQLLVDPWPPAPRGRSRRKVNRSRSAVDVRRLPARVPLAEAARRLGHSVETLVSTYIGAMEGDDAEANALVDAVLASTRDEIIVTVDIARSRPRGSHESITFAR